MTQLKTEEQILKMPADKYMNEDQIDFFRDRLLLEKTENITSQSTLKKDMKSLEENGKIEALDIASTFTDISMMSANMDRLIKKARNIENALKRIEAGEYGYCMNNGEEIGLKRLMIDPTAPLCMEEQERLEKTNKHYA